MNSFLANLLNAAAQAAKAQAQPSRGPNRKGATSCTPCAAHGYLDKIKSTYGLDQKKRRK